MSAGIVVATPSTRSSPSARGAVDGDLPRAAPDDELADEIVVELTDLVAGFVAGVPAGAETIGWGERRDRAGGREERATGRILCVDTDLDGVTADLDLVLGERQRLTGSDAVAVRRGPRR